MSDFHDWEDLRAELHDGDDEAIERERARTEAWVGAFHLAEERKRLGLTQKQVAELMGVSPGRVSQIENGDLDVNEVATLSRYARALGARMRIIFDYGSDLRQIPEALSGLILSARSAAGWLSSVLTLDFDGRVSWSNVPAAGRR
jgi:transcriptional regulator with XRE-family HTH domain